MIKIKKSEKEIVEEIQKSGYKIFKANPDGQSQPIRKSKQTDPKKKMNTRGAKAAEAEAKLEELKEPAEEQVVAKQELQPEKMNQKDALFALIGIKMMKLSQKYNRRLDELHGIFYTVSCDWKRLEQILESHKGTNIEISEHQWTMLEDLAVRDDKNSEAYRHVVAKKGDAEVKRRRMFLEID